MKERAYGYKPESRGHPRAVQNYQQSARHPPESEPGVALTLNFLVRVDNEQRLGVVARGLEQVLYVLS